MQCAALDVARRAVLAGYWCANLDRGAFAWATRFACSDNSSGTSGAQPAG